jgi:hypothetical protein
MSQRASGYARQELDRYETPGWVTRVLLPYLGSSLHVWEPAAASGQVARVLGLEASRAANDGVRPR